MINTILLTLCTALHVSAYYKVDFVNKAQHDVSYDAETELSEHFKGDVKQGQEESVETVGECWKEITFTTDFPGAGGKSTASLRPRCGTPGKIILRKKCFQDSSTERGKRCKLVIVDR